MTLNARFIYSVINAKFKYNVKLDMALEKILEYQEPTQVKPILQELVNRTK